MSRISVRGMLRVLAVGLLAACPLIAADPAVRLGPPISPLELLPVSCPGPVVGASYTGPPAGVEIPPVPLGQYPELYSGFDWSRIADQLAVAKRRNAARVPFDLKYLPPGKAQQENPEVIVAIRPSAIFDRPHGDRLVAEWLVDTRLLEFATSFFGLSGLNWPPMQDIDMIAARGVLEAKLTDNATTFTLGVNKTHGAVIRTRRRYDWRRELARATPALGTATYRGVEYRTTTVNLKLLGLNCKDEDVTSTGLYVADDYTLVIDTEDAIQRLIDRLLDARPPTEPPGWAKVSGGVFALAMSCPNSCWTRDLPGAYGPRLPKGGDWEWDTLGDLYELLIGLNDQPTTRIFLSANAGDPFTGKRMTWNAKRLLALLAAYLPDLPGEEGAEARNIWRRATFTPTFCGFTITADAGRDLLNPLLDKYAAEAKPVPPPEPELQRVDPAFVPLSGFSLVPTELPFLPGTGQTPTGGGETKRSEWELPPTPQPPPAPGFYDSSPLGGLGGIGGREP